MNKIKWIEHNNKKILYVDYSSITDENETFKIYDSLKEEIIKAASSSTEPILIISNVEKTLVNENTEREYAKHRMITKKYNIYSAVIGASGKIRSAVKILSVYDKRFSLQANLDEAKEWIISQ